MEDVSGFFRIEVHSSTGRVIWTIIAICCISSIFLGIFALKMDFFHLRQGTAAPLSILLLVVGVTIILPGFAFIVALPKSLKSSGRYLHGTRMTARGIEKGSLQLAINPADHSGNGALANKLRQQAAKQWRAKKIINDRSFEVLVILRLQKKAAGAVRFERLYVLVDGKPIQRLFGGTGNENCWQDLAILVNGAIHQIESRDTMSCGQLFPMLENLGKVLSVSTQSPPPACTVRLLTGHGGRYNPLATGILGAFVSPGCTSKSNKTLADYFDEQNARRLEKLLEEKNWRYCFSE